MSSPSVSSSAVSKTSEQCVGLQVLTVTGHRQTWIFQPDATVRDVKSHIAAQWPKDWPGLPEPATEHMRLLHLGFFWEDDAATLRNLNLPLRRTTVIHLVIRPVLASPLAKPEQSQQQSAPGKSKKSLKCLKLFRRHDDQTQAGNNKRHSTTAIGSTSPTA